MSNHAYIASKNLEIATRNQLHVFKFARIILERTKNLSFFLSSTLNNIHFLNCLKVTKAAENFMKCIDMTIVELTNDIKSFLDEVSMIVIRILQLIDKESANLFLNTLMANMELCIQYELILYRKTLEADDSTIQGCMKAMKKFLAEKRKIISTQTVILDYIIMSSPIKLSRKSCENIVQTFLDILKSIKSVKDEVNPYSCCGNLRQHICMSLFNCSLKLLSIYIKEESDKELDEDFQDGIQHIVDYFLQILQKFDCPHFEKLCVRHIYLTFRDLTQHVNHDSVAQFVISLFKDIFNNKKCQMQIYFSDEVRSFIILYSKIKSDFDKESLEELNALYIGHLIKGNNTKSKLQEKILKYYEDTKPNRTVLETINSSNSHLKMKDFDVEVLRNVERETCVKWIKHMIPKLINNATSDLEYLLLVVNDEDCVDHEKLSNIRRKALESLKSKNLDHEAKAENYLILAYTAKIDVLWKIHLMKGECIIIFLYKGLRG